jgi:hypothetical protein
MLRAIWQSEPGRGRAKVAARGWRIDVLTDRQAGELGPDLVGGRLPVRPSERSSRFLSLRLQARLRDWTPRSGS